MTAGMPPDAQPGVLLTIIKDKRIAFLIVGALNTAIGLGWYVLFFWLLGGLPAGYMFALVSAQVVSVICAFFLYRKFVFRVTGNVWRDFARFTSVYIFSFGINLVVLPLMVEGLRVGALVAQVGIILITTVVSYLGHNYFSFRRKRVSK